MQEQLDSQIEIGAALVVSTRRAGGQPRTTRATGFEMQIPTPVLTGTTTMTTQLETDRSTTLEDKLRAGSKISKIHRAPWRGRPAPMSRGPAHVALKKEYLRTLRAAEMAVWDAADRAPIRPVVFPAAEPAPLGTAVGTLDRILSSPDSAAWIAGGLAGLIVAAGVLSMITNGVLQLASLMQHIVS